MENLISLAFHTIESLNDPRYDAWLDIYQTSFPLNEQVLISSLNRMLRGLRAGDGRESTVFLFAADEMQTPVAMALYELSEESRSASLWYLAVRADIRSRGIGSLVYKEIVRRTRDSMQDLKGLIFEVETAAHAHSEEQRALAIRRIEFYRRCGAKLLGGVHYMQSVGWQPPIPMHLMVHPFKEMDASAAFSFASAAFGDTVEPAGEFTLT